jgi:UDP-N-acetylmuramoyl-L-alanyl-D-glutamate--2,6-diaminopimelate ligase
MTMPANPIEALARPVPPRFPWADPFFTVGVTGTNGKTSTTHLIASILRAAGRRVLCQSTLGYFFDGLPMTVDRSEKGYLDALQRVAEQGCRHAAVEVTSLALRNGYAKKWRFDLGVFTNLSRDHIAEHGSWEHYLASKAQLFVHLGPGRVAVLNACDEGATLIDRVVPPDVRRIWYAAPTRGDRLHAPDLAAREIVPTVTGTHVALEPSATADRLGGAIDVRLVGEVFGENALGAALAGLAMGIDGETVRAGLAACPVPPARFEIIARRPVVVLDYAHTPDALARLCSTARLLAGAHRLIVVFGAGGGYDRDKREPMGEAVGARADVAFVTNDNPRQEDPTAIAQAGERGCRRAGRAETRLQYDRRDAIQSALSVAGPDDVVVIAGRGHDRGMYFANGVVPYSDHDTVVDLLGARGQE